MVRVFYPSDSHQHVAYNTNYPPQRFLHAGGVLPVGAMIYNVTEEGMEFNNSGEIMVYNNS